VDQKLHFQVMVGVEHGLVLLHQEPSFKVKVIVKYIYNNNYIKKIRLNIKFKIRINKLRFNDDIHIFIFLHLVH
jgi:hypothetical protein